MHVLFRRGKIFFGKIPAFSSLFFKVLANTGLHDLADNCTRTCHLQGGGGDGTGVNCRFDGRRFRFTATR